jgi:ketosteroid isomerase-like protein
MRFLMAGLPALIVASAAPAATKADLDALLAQDRAAGRAAAGTDMLGALGALFDDDVVLVAGRHPIYARGKAAALARLAENPDNKQARVSWAPVGGGIATLGDHGYSYGRMTVTPAGKPAVTSKYLAYWVKTAAGWRIAALSRRPDAMPVELAVAGPVIGTARYSDDARSGVKAAEQGFSDLAQKIGLRAAFAASGRAESINIGGAPAVAVGAAKIAEGVAGPEPTSPVTWNADDARVSKAGDMGLSFGRIRFNGAPPPGAPEAIPFFTVWARPNAGDPWRYVAE